MRSWEALIRSGDLVPGMYSGPQLEAMLRFFEGLPREGPGDDRVTRHLYGLLTDLPVRPRAADMGSGSGAATLVLVRKARRSRPWIFFRLSSNGSKRRSPPGASASVSGLFEHRCSRSRFRKGRSTLSGPRERPTQSGSRRRSAPGAGSCAPAATSWPRRWVWLVDDPPAEVRDYWTAAYPGIRTIGQNATIVAGAGYRWLGSFLLPDAAWEAFYDPQRVRCREWRARRMASEEEAVVREVEEENPFARGLPVRVQGTSST